LDIEYTHSETYPIPNKSAAAENMGQYLSLGII